MLIGVSFALLDLIQFSKINLKNTIVIETGGMKGRKKEMIREELHNKLIDIVGNNSKRLLLYGTQNERTMISV